MRPDKQSLTMPESTPEIGRAFPCVQGSHPGGPGVLSQPLNDLSLWLPSPPNPNRVRIHLPSCPVPNPHAAYLLVYGELKPDVMSAVSRQKRF